METTYYLNDVSSPETEVLMTYDDQDNYKAAYSYGIERIRVQALDDTRPESQDPLYYLYDGLGSVSQMIRPNGAVRDHYGYDEYGVPSPGAKLSEDGRNVNHNTFGYTGEMWDEEDNLLYLRSRYYMPEVGRFVNRDVFPGFAENPLSMHKYAYVENNPVNWVDPLGFNKKEQNRGNTGLIDNWTFQGTGETPGIPVTTGSVVISKSGNFNYDNKISKQMVKRGWSEQMIDETIKNPTRTVNTADTRFRPDGTNNFEPATAYYNKNGGYVVRNNTTKNIVQVSDINDPYWKAPWDDDDKGGGSGGGGSDITTIDGMTYVKNSNGDWEPIGFSSLPIGGGTFPIRVPVGGGTFPIRIPVPAF